METEGVEMKALYKRIADDPIASRRISAGEIVQPLFTNEAGIIHYERLETNEPDFRRSSPAVFLRNHAKVAEDKHAKVWKRLADADGDIETPDLEKA